MSIQDDIQTQEQIVSKIMHTAIDKYILNIKLYVDYIHDRTSPEFKNIPDNIKNMLDGYGVDEIKRFRLERLVKGEEILIQSYIKTLHEAQNPVQALEGFYAEHILNSQDIEIGRAFEFNQDEKESLHKAVEEISKLKNSLVVSGEQVRLSPRKGL
jgi:hypothetical protein